MSAGARGPRAAGSFAAGWRRRLLGAAPALALAGCALQPSRPTAAPGSAAPTAAKTATDAGDGPRRSERPLSSDEQRELERHLRVHTRRTGAFGTATMRAGGARPLMLAPAARSWRPRWRIDGAEHDLDAYFDRQPVVALLVVSGTALHIERYRGGVAGDTPFLGNSMTKTVTAIAIGLALAERRIASVDEPAQRHVPELAGSAYGATTLRNLLRMGSGVRFVETYEPGDDASRFGAAAAREGWVLAARGFDLREAPQGTRFSYASVESQVLAAALRGATGETLAEWLQPRLWRPMGAAHDAFWATDRTGLVAGGGGLSASPHDWARLGAVLAHGGVRPDDGRALLPADWLADMTDASRADPPFRPDERTGRFGYSCQTWLLPGPRRQFALLGIHGQAVFVDPGLRLAMVHLAASGSASVTKTTLARERLALWRGVVRTALDAPAG